MSYVTFFVNHVPLFLFLKRVKTLKEQMEVFISNLGSYFVVCKVMEFYTFPFSHKFHIECNQLHINYNVYS